MSIIGSSSSSSKTSATTSQHPLSSSSSSATPFRACAVCEYSHRKCKPDCTLAPYFPANQRQEFLNAHRLFGVGNILKIIRNVDPDHRSDAMRSIIFQSNARARDPVGGCYRIIGQLENQLQRDYAELAHLRHLLAIYRANLYGHLLEPPDVDDHGGGATYDTHLIPPQQQPCDSFCYDGRGGGDVDHDHNIIVSTTDTHNKSQEDYCKDSWTTAKLELFSEQQNEVEPDIAAGEVDRHIEELRKPLTPPAPE